MLKIEAEYPDLRQKCQISLMRAYVQIGCLPATNYTTCAVWRVDVSKSSIYWREYVKQNIAKEPQFIENKL